MVKVKYIPVLSEPVIPERPIPPQDLDKQFQDPIGLTKTDAKIYIEACEAWESSEYTDEEILFEYSLTRSAACDWVIYGQTLQGNFNVESIFNQMAGYKDELENHIDFLERTIENLWTKSQAIKSPN